MKKVTAIFTILQKYGRESCVSSWILCRNPFFLLML